MKNYNNYIQLSINIHIEINFNFQSDYIFKFISYILSIHDKDDCKQVLLGSWERGQEYTNDIIENLNHYSNGWTDWNLVLDMNGGLYFCVQDD